MEGFLAAHPGWRVVPVREVAQTAGSAHPEYLALTPARHGTDGFFAAVVEREEEAVSLPERRSAERSIQRQKRT